MAVNGYMGNVGIELMEFWSRAAWTSCEGAAMEKSAVSGATLATAEPKHKHHVRLFVSRTAAGRTAIDILSRLV